MATIEHNINNIMTIDGAFGEGGGQIIRTALALSAITGKGFKAVNIRKGRDKPGLKHQHLYCIKALKDLCNAKAIGDELGSEELIFLPQKLSARALMIDIKTAGSITLVLQALLLPSIFAERDMRIKLIGGTDTSWSMPIDYFSNILLHHIKRFADIELSLEKRGYYPKGQGKVDIKIRQQYRSIDFSDIESMLEFLWDEKRPINLTERGNLVLIKGISHASSTLELQQVATRQARAAKVMFSRLDCPTNIQVSYTNTECPGSGIVLWANFVKDQEFADLLHNNTVRLCSDVLGEKGIKSELIGEKAAKNLLETINTDACVDRFLADNLIPFMAFFGGSIKVEEITEHTKTNIDVVERFLPVKFQIEDHIITVKRI